MGLFGLGKKSKIKKAQRLLIARYDTIKARIDKYIVNWGPRYLSSANEIEELIAISQRSVENLKTAKKWLDAISLRDGAGPHLSKLEVLLSKLDENYNLSYSYNTIEECTLAIWEAIRAWANNN